MFGVLAVLVWNAWHPHRFSYIGAWFLTVSYAAIDEWHQSFQPGRTALLSDVVIDACGAAVFSKGKIQGFPKKSAENYNLIWSLCRRN